jgi:acyl carrier protein
MTTRELIKELMTEAGISDYSDMDSLDFLDMCCALESKLGIRIPDDKLGSIKTENDLVEAIDGLRATV